MKWKLSRITPGVMKLRGEVSLLGFAWKHPDTPWYAKAGMALAVLYLVSPIDIVPDVLPFAGMIDDLVLVPLGLMGASWAVPAHVRAAYERAQITKKAWHHLPWLLLTLLTVGVCILIAVWLNNNA